MQEYLPQPITAGSEINPDYSTAETNRAPGDLGRRAAIALVAFFVWAASVAFIALVPAIFLIPYLSSNNIQITDSAQIVEFAKSDPMAIVIQVAAIVPAHLLTLLLAWIVVSQGRKFKLLKTLGWENGGIAWWHYIAILVVFLAIAVVVGIFVPEQENELIRMLQSSRYVVYVMALIATFSAPFIEELVYRGVLYSAFQRAFGVVAAVVLVTLLFALVHVPQYYPSFSTIFLLTLLSLTLTGLRYYSNNLLPCVILHTLFNAFQSVMLIVEPYLREAAKTEPVAAFIYSLK